MPEGDTIHRSAARLRPALAGRALVRLHLARRPGAGPRPGTLVEAVEAVGKHLLVRFGDGHVLRTHLGMTGRWDLYRPGQRWRRPAHLARAVVEVEGAVAVCFTAPVVELTRSGTRLPRPVAELGPDLCDPAADLDAVVERMGRLAAPDAAVADVLLDQRVAAGVGNVYKSEVCWACRVHPLTPVGRLDGPTRRALVERAADLLRRNLGTGRRTTVTAPSPGGRGAGGALAVYRRARRPCRRCGTPIVRAETDPNRRSTYWCPRCQPGPAPGAG